MGLGKPKDDIVVLFEFVHLYGLILLACEILGSQRKTKHLS